MAHYRVGEAASLDTDSGVPGEGPGNVVAKAEGCSVCFLTLETPVDLSAYDSVTLSFYRWLDPGMNNSEFLGVDIGNNGAYRRLHNWSGQHADGEWHLETITLSGDQISNSFTLRFFGIAQNNFTTFAIDNVMIAATPGSVVVTPIIPEQTPDLDETVNRPDLMVEHGLALSRTVQAGAAITFYPRTTNVGTASAPSTTIRVYRHEQETTTPRVGGIEETRTARSAALAPDRSAITVAHATAPSTAGVHYYYLCLDHVTNETVTNNNCTQTPATVSIEQTATDPGQEEVPETTPTTVPDVTVTETAATAPSALAGDTISIQATITNIGSAAADATTIHVYRHTHKTINPLGGGGTQEANTATTPTLAPNKSVQVTSTHQAPSVLEATTYYYYICLAPLSGEQTTDNNCSSTPAIITVRPKQEEKIPDHRMKAALMFQLEVYRWGEILCMSKKPVIPTPHPAAPSPLAVLKQRPACTASWYLLTLSFQKILMTLKTLPTLTPSLDTARTEPSTHCSTSSAKSIRCRRFAKCNQKQDHTTSSPPMLRLSPTHTRRHLAVP